MADHVALIPKGLPEKRELLKQLEEQLKALNNNKTKENEAQRGQLGDFIKMLKTNIAQHEDQIRQHFAMHVN